MGSKNERVLEIHNTNNIIQEDGVAKPLALLVLYIDGWLDRV